MNLSDISFFMPQGQLFGPSLLSIAGTVAHLFENVRVLQDFWGAAILAFHHHVEGRRLGALFWVMEFQFPLELNLLGRTRSSCSQCKGDNVGCLTAVLGSDLVDYHYSDNDDKPAGKTQNGANSHSYT